MNIFKARVLIMPAKDRLFELLESLEAKELEYLLKKILEVDSEEFKKKSWQCPCQLSFFAAK